MGVIKNEVGRPTNKSIMIRRILKLILLLVIVAGVFCAGYYIKDKEDTNKKEDNKDNKKTVSKIDVYSKYKNVQFVRKTKFGGESDFFIDYTSNDQRPASLEIIKGKIVANVYDDNNENKTEIKVTGINSKVKYITAFNVPDFDIPMGLIAALTEDNSLYVGNYNYNDKTYKFIKLSDNIIDMAEDFDSSITGDVITGKSSLYLLNNKGELKYAECDENNKCKLTNHLYEERYKYVGNYHEGGISYIAYIYAKDNSVKIDAFSDVKTVKIDGKNIIVKDVITNENEKTSSIYIITKDNRIITTLKNRYYNCSEDSCYSFKYYNELKVKSVDYVIKKDKDEKEYKVAKVTYTDGTTEEIRADYSYTANN